MQNDYLELLGFEVEDRITRFRGTVTSISFDLFGCVQAIVTSKANDNKVGESCWYDLKRLRKISTEPVMEVPSFKTVPGGQALPQYPSQPIK